MSLQINKLHITHASVQPAPDRRFNISPAVYGKSEWNLDEIGPLSIGTFGVYTITPLRDMEVGIKMWGGGGTGSDGGAGGGGGYGNGKLNVTANETYVIVVGEAGKVRTSVTNNPTTIGGGRAGTSLMTGKSYSGGGLSGIFANAYTHGNAILVAGGGAGNASAYYSGAGGGSSGQNGNPSSGNGYGTGGTQVTGGNAYGYGGGTGSMLLGGRGEHGGGAGGYFGGGGGTINHPSGGGSGYIKQSVISGSSVVGDKSIPANSMDTDRGNSGRGGGAYNSNIIATDGRVIIF